MADKSDASLSIGADDAQLLTALERSKAQIMAFGAQLEAGFRGAIGSADGLSKTIESMAAPVLRLTGMFATLGAVAGGAAFKVAIDESKKLTGEAIKLAGTLGITTSEASALNTALGAIGSDADTYVGAFQHFARQLKANEAGFQEMGLKTRDANGHLRDAQTLFMDAVADVSAYAQGLDQTTAAMTYFGKSIDDVRALQKLNSAEIEEGDRRAKALGLTITENNVKAAGQYKRAMNELNQVMAGLKKVVGDAVMPIFAKFGQWLADAGPTSVDVMRKAMGALVAVYETFRFGLVSTYDVLVAFSHTLGEVGNFVNIVWQAMKRGDLSGIGVAFDRMRENIGTGWRKTMLGVKADASDTAKRLNQVWSGDESPGVPAGKGGHKTMGTLEKGKEPKSRVPEWEETLNRWRESYQQMNADQGTFYQLGKAQERDYWKNVLDTQRMTDVERRAVLAKYVSAAGDLQKQQFEGDIARLRAQETEFQANAERRIEIVRQAAERIKTAYGEESKEYQEAQRRVIETQRAVSLQRRALEMEAFKQLEAQQLARVDLEQHSYLARAELSGQTIRQMLEQDLAFEEQRRQIKLQYAQQALASIDPEKDPVRYEQVKAQLLEIERQYQARRQGIVLDAQKKIGQPIANIFSNAESSINSMLMSLFSRTQSWSDKMRGLFRSLGATIIEELVTKRLAAEAVGLAKEILFGKAKVAVKAAEAGAGAASTAAETPFVGWAMALPAMASVFAGVLGLQASIPAAAQGWDIPAGMNPMTQLHQREMVLPAAYADVIRGLGDGGGTSSSGDVHLHLSTPDAEGARRFLLDNRAALADAMRTAMRDGMLMR